MSEQEFDEVYTRLCHALSEAGMERTPFILARLSLLLMARVDDAACVHEAIGAALEATPVGAGQMDGEQSPA